MRRLFTALILILLLAGCRQAERPEPATTTEEVQTTSTSKQTQAPTTVPTTTAAAGDPEPVSVMVLTVDYQVVNDQYLYGLIDREGQPVVEYDYDYIEPMEDTGLFLGSLGDERYLIDMTTAEVKGPYPAEDYLAALDEASGSSEPVRFQDQETYLYGYRQGEKELTEAVYSYASPFRDGLAVVREAPYYENDSAVINRNFEEVFTHEEGIVAYGQGYFGLVQEYTVYSNNYNRVILVNTNKEPILDEMLFEVDVLTNDLLLVANHQGRWLINGQGENMNHLWDEAGLIKLNSDGRAEVIGGNIYIYKSLEDESEFDVLDADGKILYEGIRRFNTRTEDLGQGYKLEGRTKYSDRFVNLAYPAIIYEKDQERFEKANAYLMTTVGGDDMIGQPVEDVTMTFEADYMAERIGQILRVEFSYYWYGFGAAHPNYYGQTVHIDLSNGRIYELVDMMKSSDAFETLTDQIQAIAAESPDMYFSIDTITVDENTQFNIRKDGIELYYDPYEIGPYAAGTLSFFIPFTDFEEDLNIYSDFYNHLN